MHTTKTERYSLLIVLLVAGILRTAYPGLTEFKADEARLYTLGYKLATAESFPLHGITSSIGLPNFPLSAWLYAVPISLWRHPYSPTLFTGLLNTLSVYASWWFVRRHWGSRTGFICALLYTVSPWAIIFSRKIWAQNLLPLFVIAWAITAVMTFISGKRRAALTHGVLLGCIPQIHFSGLTLVLISLVSAAFSRQRVQWKWLLAGTGISIAFALPLLIHLSTQDITSFASFSAINPTFQIDSAIYSWMLSLGSDITSLAGNSIHLDTVKLNNYLSPVYLLWAILIALGCWRFLQVKRGNILSTETFILGWLLAPIIVLLWSPFPVYPHYFIVTFPAQYIAAARGATTIMDRFPNPKVRVSLWALILVSAFLQIWALFYLHQTITKHATPGAYGTPLERKLVAAQKALNTLTTTNANEILVVGNGNNPSFHEFPAVYDALLSGTNHRFIDGSTSAVHPKTPAVILLQPGNQPAQQFYLQLSSETASIPMRFDESHIKVLGIRENNTPFRANHVFTPPISFANGITLTGLHLAETTEFLQWELHWLTGEKNDKLYHFYNHLLDSSGNRLAQDDRPAFPANQWRNGDRVISFFSAPITKVPSALRIGMYTYPQLENIPIITQAGNFEAPDVTINILAP